MTIDLRKSTHGELALANLSKTQLGVCFPPKESRSQTRNECRVEQYQTLKHNNTVYLGVRLDRTLCYKTHIEKTKMKVNARNNIIRKLANSKWGARHRHSDPAVSPSATQLPNAPALCGQGLHTRAS